jgi:hypothetical protein
MSYCVQGKEKECQKAREKVKKANGGKLPEKFKGTTLESCIYCSAFMVSY